MPRTTSILARAGLLAALAACGGQGQGGGQGGGQGSGQVGEAAAAAVGPAAAAGSTSPEGHVPKDTDTPLAASPERHVPKDIDTPLAASPEGHVPKDIDSPLAAGPPWTLPRTPKAARSVAQDPSGALLVTGHDGGEVRIWSAAARSRAFTLTGQLGAITALALSADGALLATGADDGSLRLWFLEDTLDPRSTAVRGAEPRAPRREGVVPAATPFNPPLALDGHEGPIRALVFSADGRRLLSAEDGGGARIWATDGREAPREIGRPGAGLLAATLSGDGRRAATVPLRGPPQVWEIDAGRSTILARAEGPAAASVLFSIDGDRLALVDLRGGAALWRRGDEGWVHEVDVAPPAAAAELAAEVVALAPEARAARLWSALGPSLPPDAAALPGFAAPTAFVWVTDGRVTLRSTVGAKTRALPGRTPPIGVAMSPGGDRVTVIAADATVRSWGAPAPAPAR